MQSRAIRAAGCVLAIALVFDFGTDVALDTLGAKPASLALAQEGGRAAKRKKKRTVPNITEATYRRLTDAQEFVDAEQWRDALNVLNGMAARGRRYNGNERGQIHNMLAYVNFELDNMSATIRHYEQVLAQVPDITEVVEQTTLQQLSKLYFQQGNEASGDEASAWFQKALTTMEEWLSMVDNPGPEAHFYMAKIYYQMRDFTNAIARLEMVIELARKFRIRVQEQWWTMLQFLYFEQENWPKVIEILEILVKEYPKRIYWVNLASVYGETGRPDKQLWTLEAAHTGGYLDKESDIRAYGGLLLQGEIPNRASKYLRQGFDDEIVERSVQNLQTLGQAYLMGQDVEKAIPLYEEAGKLAEDGETYDNLSGLYLAKDEFSKCQIAAEKALEKGGLKNPLVTKITLGTCQFNLNRLTGARETFVEVRRSARRERARREERIASQWIAYIDSERKRREALALAGG